MLTTVHSALDDRILHREARTLSEAGLSVCVIGPHVRHEVIDGVTIDPLPAPTSRWQRLGLHWTLFKKAQRAQGPVYIFHDPELFGVALALRAAGKKVIYDSHENLPMQALQKEWIPKPVRYLLVPLIYAAEWVVSHLLSGVIGATPLIQKRFSGVPNELVRNFPTASALRVLAPQTAVEKRDNVAIYAGSLTRIRGVRELIAAFSGIPNAELWLVGPFEDRALEQEILARLPENVKYLGTMPFKQVLALYGSAKLGVLVYYPSPNNRKALPIKLFEYMAAGLPVLTSNLPEFEAMTAGCGISVDPHNVDQIRAAITSLLSNPAMIAEMSTVARRRALQEFTWEAEGERLVQFCSSLLPRTKSCASSVPL
jgi:hypothetical protein